MRLTFVSVLLGLVALLSAWDADAEPRAFKLIDGQVVITVTLNGRELPALLDTGATYSMIDADLAAELGIRIRRQAGGTTGASEQQIPKNMTQTVSLDIGAGMRRPKLYTYENGHAFAPDGVQVLIGMNLLNKLAITLDFRAMTIDMGPAAKLAPPIGQPLALKRAKMLRLTLPVAVGDNDVDVMLDTAASSALHLQRHVVEQSPALSALAISRRQVVGIDGMREFDAIVVPELALGGHTFRNVRATVAAKPTDRAIAVDGVVGVDLLRHFHVVFDFDRDKVWMTPIAE